MQLRFIGAFHAEFADQRRAGVRRTIDALGLRDKRIRRGDDDVRRAYVAERYTLQLRTLWYPFTETAYVIPVVAALLVGGLLVLMRVREDRVG